jgi:hypothetical protein
MEKSVSTIGELRELIKGLGDDVAVDVEIPQIHLAREFFDDNERQSVWHRISGIDMKSAKEANELGHICITLSEDTSME